MNRKGYDRDFNIAVTASAATTGLLIPPSNIMIVYALVAGNVSVAALFLAGILPGVVIGSGIMLVAFILCKTRGYGKRSDADTAEQPSILHALLGAFPSLLLIVIVLGGNTGWYFHGHRGISDRSALGVLVGRGVLS